MATKTAVTAQMTLKPDQIESAMALVRRFQVETMEYPGLLIVRALHSPSEPTRLMFYTEFESEEASAQYLQWRRQRGDFELLADLLAAPPLLQSWPTVIGPA